MKKILSVLLIMTLVISSITIAQFGYAANPTETNRYTVLILDTSGSMNGTPASKQKEAAIKFCESMLNSEGNNYIAIVKLNTSSSVGLNFSKDLSALKSYIQNIPASGGTNINQSLTVADALLRDIPASVTAPIKNIVLCSDGLPESGSTNNNGPYTSSEYSGYQYANAVYNTATTLKPSYNIYTLGFFHKLSGSNLNFGRKFMNDIQNAGYYEVIDPNELEFAFGEIADDIQDNNCPIIIIPGIMGSNLYFTNTEYSWKTKAWPPGGNLLQTAYGLVGLGDIMKNWVLFTRPCENQNDSGVTREYGARDEYKSLVDGLCAKFGNCNKNSKDYREIYFFSYDFRQSNAKTAQELAWFINNKGFKKVDIVAHSMGGLVASNYMKSEENRKKVGKLITCGTPYEGAPKLINCILNWDVLGNKHEGGLGNAISDDFLGLAGLTKDVKSSFTSTAELCPTKNYFGYYKWYRYSYSTHTGLLNLKTTRYYNVINYNTYKEICTNIFGDKYEDAVKVQNDLNVNGYNLLTTLDNTFFVIGINQWTIGSLWFNDGTTLNSLECDDLAYEHEGDGTVPYYSATIANSLNTLENKEKRVLEVTTDHGGTCKDSTALNWIYDVLRSGSSTISSDMKDDKPFVVVRIACPVDVTIEHNGEGLSSDYQNLSVESSFGRLDILGGNDDVKMLCLENTEALTLNLTGTDDGTMNYTIRWFDEKGNLLEERYVENVPVTKDMVATTTTSNSETNSVIAIDRDGDGEIDSEVIANSNGGSYDLNALLKKLMDVFKTILELFLKIVISLVNTNVEANESAAA